MKFWNLLASDLFDSVIGSANYMWLSYWFSLNIESNWPLWGNQAYMCQLSFTLLNMFVSFWGLRVIGVMNDLLKFINDKEAKHPDFFIAVTSCEWILSLINFNLQLEEKQLNYPHFPSEILKKILSENLKHKNKNPHETKKYISPTTTFTLRHPQAIIFLHV